jgi:hypothetical protein
MAHAWKSLGYFVLGYVAAFALSTALLGAAILGLRVFTEGVNRLVC